MEEVKECNSDAKEGLVFSASSVLHNSCGNAVPKLDSVQRRTTGPTRRSTKGGWTEKEDKILEFAVQKFNSRNWKQIAKYVTDRTDVQCLHRWQKVLNPDLVKGPWTKEEDDLIIQLVEKLQGNKKWSEIAKSLSGRIGKQCRERWHNHLNPEIIKTAWTKEEELVLIENHKIYGNRWAEIAKLLHGRTENSIKNHWNCSVKKKADLCLAHDQRKSSVDTCSLLGNANGKENHLHPFTRGSCSHIRTAVSPVSFLASPSRHDKGTFVGCSSPESTLRRAARSFKNMPSIIRKRGLRTSRQTVKIANHSDDICTPEEKKTDKSSNSPHYVW